MRGDRRVPISLPVSSRWARTAERVRRELERVFAARDVRRNGKRRLATVDCCVTPIATLDEAMIDPQFAAREMVLQRSDGSR